MTLCDKKLWGLDFQSKQYLRINFRNTDGFSSGFLSVDNKYLVRQNFNRALEWAFWPVHELHITSVFCIRKLSEIGFFQNLFLSFMGIWSCIHLVQSVPVGCPTKFPKCVIQLWYILRRKLQQRAFVPMLVWKRSKSSKLYSI